MYRDNDEQSELYIVSLYLSYRHFRLSQYAISSVLRLSISLFLSFPLLSWMQRITLQEKDFSITLPNCDQPKRSALTRTRTGIHTPCRMRAVNTRFCAWNEKQNASKFNSTRQKLLTAEKTVRMRAGFNRMHPSITIGLYASREPHAKIAGRFDLWNIGCSIFSLLARFIFGIFVSMPQWQWSHSFPR